MRLWVSMRGVVRELWSWDIVMQIPSVLVNLEHSPCVDICLLCSSPSLSLVPAAHYPIKLCIEQTRCMPQRLWHLVRHSSQDGSQLDQARPDQPESWYRRLKSKKTNGSTASFQWVKVKSNEAPFNADWATSTVPLIYLLVPSDWRPTDLVHLQRKRKWRLNNSYVESTWVMNIFAKCENFPSWLPPFSNRIATPRLAFSVHWEFN